MPSSRPFGPSATASTSGGPGNEVRLGGLRADVVHDQLVTALLDVGRHAGAHGAEPDESDLHGSRLALTLRTVACRRCGARRRRGSGPPGWWAAAPRCRRTPAARRPAR